MKKAIIVTLVCINMALVGALILGASTPPAKAQVIGVSTDYLVVTGRISKDQAAIYVLDLGKQALGVWEFDKTNKRFRAIGARMIKADFARRR